MANSATRDSLIARARQESDNENSFFVTDAEVLGWLNIGLSELYDIIITQFEDYAESVYIFNTIAGTQDYTLPIDFYKLQGVDLIEGQVNYTLRRFMNNERNRYQTNIYPAMGRYFRYRIIGDKIRFMPIPQGAKQIRVSYAPLYAPLNPQVVFTCSVTAGSPLCTNTSIDTIFLSVGSPISSVNINGVVTAINSVNSFTVSNNASGTSGSNTITASNNVRVNQMIPPGWEEFAVLDAAIKCIIKEESDPSPYFDRKNEIRKRITDAVADRDANEPARIVDTTRGLYSYGYSAWGGGYDAI